jgi:hypothetical protein
MHRKFSAILQNHQNSILFHETIPLRGTSKRITKLILIKLWPYVREIKRNEELRLYLQVNSLACTTAGQDTFLVTRWLQRISPAMLYWGDIFRKQNPSVWQIPMFSQIFPLRNMDRLCAKCTVCKKKVYCCLNIP